MNTESESETIFIEISLDQNDDERLARMIYEIINETKSFEGIALQLVKGNAEQYTKSIDPVILGLISATVVPYVLPKFLEFLQAWSMRREGRTIKIKIQKKDGNLIEIEVPQTTSHQEIQQYIEIVKKAMGTKNHVK